MSDCDLAVIGAGAAGLSVTAVAAQLGLRVVLIERGRMGGDCLNTGCVPSGLEMAQAFAGLGSRVTIVEAARIAGREDPELADGLRAVLARDGVEIIENQAVAAAEPGPALILADGSRVAGSHLLVAA